MISGFVRPIVAMRRTTDSRRVSGKPGQDLRAEVRRQVRHDQRDRLRMLVDDVREQVLAIDVPQEAERRGLDRLANVVERRGGACAQRLLDQRSWPAPGRRRGRPATGLASVNSLITRSCSSAVIVRVRAISIDTCSTCFGSSFDISCAGLLLRQRHQQHGRVVNVGHGRRESEC